MSSFTNWIDPFLLITLISIGTNLDNVGVGLAYGIHQIRIPAHVNVLINLIGLLISFLGATSGTFLAHAISLDQAKWVSCLVLVGIGLSFLTSLPFLPSFRPKELQVLERLDLRHGLLLGFILSFTNFASGFGATVAGSVPISWTILSISVWGYVLIWLGNVVAHGFLSRFLGRYSSMMAGLLMIVIGIHQVLS
ncbi:MAG: manganese efflux pump MntP [Tumebacillaceae bacterium]